MTEPQLIIINAKGQFLRHEGHGQYWTPDREQAMIYSKPDVAEALAKLHKGKVVPL